MATTRIQIGPADHGRRMTLDEFREADEEPGYRYELARGVLEVTEVPNDPHGQIVRQSPRGRRPLPSTAPRLDPRIGGAGEFRLWVPEMISGRNPDLAIVLRGTPKDDRGRRRRASSPRSSPSGAKTATTSRNARSTSFSASANTGSSIPRCGR